MSILKDNTSATDRARPRAGLAVASVLLAALALVLFRPWVDRPFDILDFSEFLPYLTGHATFWGRTSALVQYYLSEHARLNLVSYAALAAKWSLLGDAPVAWQWARVLQMGAVVAGVYLLFRRLSLRPYPALAGASLFVAGRLVGEAWSRMTMGEPLGLLFALGALLLATTWREHPRALWRAVAAGVLMALAILAKEMLVGLLPLVWFVGAARGPDGRLGRPLFDPDLRRLCLASALAPLAIFAVVMRVALGGGSGGFTNMYGHTPPTVHRFVNLLSRPWIVQGDRGGSAAFAIPGNALFLLVLVAGSWAQARDATRRASLAWTVGAAAALSCCFAVLYLPWPYTYLYYAIPFLLGPALLFGMAVQALADESKDGRVATGAVALLLLLLAPGTAQATSATIANQQLNGEIVRTLGLPRNADRIVVARNGPAPQPWMGTGPTLRRYALATGVAPTLPPAEDIGCRDAGELLQHPLARTVFVTYLAVCGGLQGSSAHLARDFRVVEIDWSGISIRTDSVVADVLIGQEAMGRPAPTR